MKFSLKVFFSFKLYQPKKFQCLSEISFYFFFLFSLFFINYTSLFYYLRVAYNTCPYMAVFDKLECQRTMLAKIRKTNSIFKTEVLLEVNYYWDNSSQAQRLFVNCGDTKTNLKDAHPPRNKQRNIAWKITPHIGKTPKHVTEKK